MRRASNQAVNLLLTHVFEPFCVGSIRGIMGLLDVIQGPVSKLACFRVVLFIIDVVMRSLEYFHRSQQPAAVFLNVNRRVVIHVLAVINGCLLELCDRSISLRYSDVLAGIYLWIARLMVQEPSS